MTEIEPAGAPKGCHDGPATRQRRRPRLQLPQWADDRFDLGGDPALLQRLVDDQAMHAGALAPADCWNLPEASTCGPMEGLLGDWCGSFGQKSFAEQLEGVDAPFDAALVQRGMEYLHALDAQGAFAAVDSTTLARANWRLFDFGSAIDCLLITAFVDWPELGAQILEVGGGFGRLPEFFWRAQWRDFQYVNIDAVPASLMFCYQYLKRHCDGASVLLYLDSPADRETLAQGVDFLIVPAWHAQQALGERRFDLAVNVESFQEMNQALVDHYIALFDARVRSGGCVFMTNARDYLFQGEYRFPLRWECLLRHHTLRSWSGDQPTEIFRVGDRDATAVERVRAYFYRRELELALQEPARRHKRHG